MSGSGISWNICKSAPRSRQITMPSPHHSVFTGRMPFLPPNQQHQSTEGTVNHTVIYIVNRVLIIIHFQVLYGHTKAFCLFLNRLGVIVPLSWLSLPASPSSMAELCDMDPTVRFLPSADSGADSSSNKEHINSASLHAYTLSEVIFGLDQTA